MSRLGLELSAVRELVGGGEIVGDGGFVCRSVASLGAAGPEDLSFARDARYFDAAAKSRAGALIVPERVTGFGGAQLIVADAFLAFGLVLAHVARVQRAQPGGIHPTAVIDPSAEIGDGVTIGPGAVVREQTRIGDRSVLYANVYLGQRSRVGSDSVLYPNVVIMEDVTAGDRLVVHGGSVIGAEGYGYAQHEGRHLKIPQVGSIGIGDDVEIGALATIDRATMDRTTIGRGTKIGDLVHIAHNCEIGEDTLILPTCAISGSVTIGDRVLMAGRAGTADNVSIGDDAVVAGTSVAYQDVPAGASVWGNPARDKALEMRVQSALKKLPQMLRDLRRLERERG